MSFQVDVQQKIDALAARVAELEGDAGTSRVKRGVATVTGATLDIATGLTTIEGAVLTLAEDPGAGAGDVFQLSYTASGGTLTAKIWQDDATAATEDTDIAWVAWGS